MANKKGISYVPKWYIPTPSVLVNQHLYRGGIPSGSLIQVQSSGEATFKSSVAIAMLGEAQRMGLDVAYIDAEGALNSYLDFDEEGNEVLRNEWLEGMGLKPNETYFWGADTGENIWEKTYEFIKEDNVKVVVLDSIHSIQPTKLHDSESGSHIIGAHANLHTKGILKLLPILRQNDAIVIGINHKRVHMTQQGAMGEKPGGGKAWGFYSQFIFVNSRTTSKSKLEGKDIIPLNIYIEKNKGGKNFISIDTYARQSKGIAVDVELGLLAQEKGLVRRAGSWWKTADGEAIGQSPEALGEWSLANKELILKTE